MIVEGTNKLVLHISTGLDLTNASAIAINMLKPDGTALSPALTGSVYGSASSGVISAVTGVLSAGKYVIQPEITFSDDTVIVCDAKIMRVMSRFEVDVNG